MQEEEIPLLDLKTKKIKKWNQKITIIIKRNLFICCWCLGALGCRYTYIYFVEILFLLKDLFLQDEIFNNNISIYKNNKIIIIIQSEDGNNKKKEPRYVLASRKSWSWLAPTNNNSNTFFSSLHIILKDAG